jgi:cell division protein YceG involved in septum cleavage
MNKYFKAAVKRFQDKFNKQFHINPIGERDAEIVTELKEILNKLGQKQVLAILKDYKFKEDQQILDELMQFNIDNTSLNIGSSLGSDDSKARNLIDKLMEDSPEKEQWVILEGQRIEFKLIFGYEKVITDGKLFLKLNPCSEAATKIPLYGNHMIEYYSEEELDAAVEMMDNNVEQSGGEFLEE